MAKVQNSAVLANQSPLLSIYMNNELGFLNGVVTSSNNINLQNTNDVENPTT